MNADFSEEELQNIIKQHLTDPHKDLLSEAIIGLLDSNWQKKLLLKAILGLKPESVHKLHEEYLVKYINIGTWLMHEANSKAAGLIDHNGYVKCTLIAFKPWTFHPYKITFKTRNDADEEITITTDVRANELHLVEEFPEDMIDHDRP